MDLTFSAEEEAFREEVRAFIAEAMPPHIRDKADSGGHFEHDEIMQWHRVLFDKGWVAPHWPVEHGGPGFDATHRFILTQELALAGTPGLSPFGLTMVSQVIMRFGTDAQKQRFLPKILSGEEVWCQGYSEPNAGSDLASLRTSAVLDGDDFVVNGQKTWTTYAQYADWIFCLVRTDPGVKKQAGISFLLIDMRSEGIEVKPMLTLGHTPAFCDTFFDNVRVPRENLVGEIHTGWTVAKALLGHERTMVAGVPQVQRMLRRAKRVAAETRAGGASLLADPVWAERIARVEMRLMAHQMANYRALAEQQAGKHPGPESSILKLVGSELQQEADELCMELMGLNSMSWFNEPGTVPAHERGVSSQYCYDRATTIYAGSNEIQKNILSKLILQLPSR